MKPCGQLALAQFLTQTQVRLYLHRCLAQSTWVKASTRGRGQRGCSQSFLAASEFKSCTPASVLHWADQKMVPVCTMQAEGWLLSPFSRGKCQGPAHSNMSPIQREQDQQQTQTLAMKENLGTGTLKTAPSEPEPSNTVVPKRTRVTTPLQFLLPSSC